MRAGLYSTRRLFCCLAPPRKVVNGELNEAIDALELFVEKGAYVSAAHLYCLLKCCMAQKDAVAGRRAHLLASRSGYDCNTFVANHIIRMYACHGRLQEALQVFHKLDAPNGFMWFSIIWAHAEHGQPGEVMRLYRRMQESSVKPDNHVFVAVLKACASAADLASGKQVHADVLRSAVQPDIFVGNSLVHMYAKCGSLGDARGVFDALPTKDVVTWTAMIAGYAKCGSLEDARRLFDSMPVRNVVSWNALITGYAQHGLGQEAFDLYVRMQQEDGLMPADHVTFICLLRACASMGALHQGKQLYAHIQDQGLEGDVFIGNSLVDMFAKCGNLGDARRVFDRLSTRDVASWTSMIAGYAQHGLGQEALTLYATMQQEAITAPNNVTFVCLLKACSSIGALGEGRKLHSEIQERRLEADLVLGSCLVDMYAKCGSVQEARETFDNLPARDVVTWNVMLAGYVQNGLGEESLNLYAGMQQEGVVLPDTITFACLLKACANVRAVQMGKQLQREIKVRGFEADVVIGNCLVDMFAKCDSIEDARSAFDGLARKDVVTWTVMIAGYAEHGLGREALSLYERMLHEGLTPPDHITYICLLKACSSVGALQQGKQLHSQIQDRGWESDLVIGNCLVDMYAKCGSLQDACSVFDGMQKRDVVTWTALIGGYAQHGCAEEAFQCYDKMRLADVIPDVVTFLSLLSACSHAGLVDKGVEYFESMSKNFGIAPEIEHYVSMVDLFGRAGCFSGIKDLLSTMQMQPDLAMWLCLLGACRNHGNVEMGEHAFGCAVQLKPQHPSAYVMMAHIYADAGLLEHAKEVQMLRQKEGAWKKPGQSWIEHEQEVHYFAIGDYQHPEYAQLCDVLLKVSVQLQMEEVFDDTQHTSQ